MTEDYFRLFVEVASAIRNLRIADDNDRIDWNSAMTNSLQEIQNHVTALLERHGEKE